YSHSYLYSDRNSHLYSNCYRDIHANSYSYSYSYSHGHSNLHTYSDRYIYANANSYAHICRGRHLLDELQLQCDRPGRPGRAERKPELHHRRLWPQNAGGRRQPHLLVELRHAPGQRHHDRPGRLGRAEREPELHHWRQWPDRGGG